MTQPQLQARVKLWQERLALLGIGTWRYTVELLDHIEDRADDDPQARADTDAYYNTVKFLFKRGAVERRITEGTLDELIVHEWLHVVDRNQDHVVRQLMEYLPQVAQDEMEVREEAARENRIEQMARLLVSLH